MKKNIKIDLDLDDFKIILQFSEGREPLVIQFDTPSRRFYFSLIALVANEMKKQERPNFIHIRKHQNLLKLLDKSLLGKHASKNTDGMWAKINMAWRYRLPDLETAALFKIQNRNLIQPYEKGGKYRYECLEEESDIWANLFAYDESNIWRFKLAVDAVSLNLEDVSIVLGNLKNNEAWKEFLSQLDLAETKANGEIEPLKNERPKKWLIPAVVIVGLLILLMAGIPIVNYYFRPVMFSTEFRRPDIPSIAVMPFINIDDDSSLEYLSVGITEDIINNLARINDLRVISRTSSYYFKNKAMDIRTIGEKLKVNNILEGSVRVSGNKLKISAQLIKVADDSHLWAQTYERELKDYFEIQESLAKVITCKIGSRLGCNGHEFMKKRYTDNYMAYECYLKGRHLWLTQRHEDALKYFEQAIAIDPKYALAYTGMADAYNRMAFYLSAPVNEYHLKAKNAAMKALDIDDMLPEAYASLGYMKLHFEWDWKGAKMAFQKAIELNPGNVLAHQYYSSYLKAMGRLDEAFAEIKIALELDPLSRSVNHRIGILLLMDGQVDEAITHYNNLLELYPNYSEAVLFMGFAYVLKGHYTRGIELLKKAEILTKGRSSFPLAFMGYAHGLSGNREKAREILNEVFERRKKKSFSSNWIALIYSSLDDKDSAFEWLEKGYKERDPAQYAIKARAKWFKGLPPDPRWNALLKKMGLDE